MLAAPADRCSASAIASAPAPANSIVCNLPVTLQEHVSSQFLEDQLHVLRPLAAGQYLAPRVTNLALQYLTRALELKTTYKQLKPHIEPLLSQVGVLTPATHSDCTAVGAWWSSAALAVDHSAAVVCCVSLAVLSMLQD